MSGNHEQIVIFSEDLNYICFFSDPATPHDLKYIYIKASLTDFSKSNAEKKELMIIG